MSFRVILNQERTAATVAGSYHSTQVVGVDDARRWVAIYRRMAGGRFGQFYRGKLAAFEEVLRQMEGAGS
jgi:hypothetical protein